jgi:DNA-binding Xre family transcriptional regulator
MLYKINEMTKEITLIKESAIKLMKSSDNIQAVNKNVDRLLAIVKMLEINISDIKELYP